nr:unnamed protein product [Callosobruchus chinensis]
MKPLILLLRPYRTN